MGRKEPNSTSLIISLLTLVIGVILCFNGGDGLFKIIGYTVSGILIFSGIIKFIVTYLGNKKHGDNDVSGIIMSVILVALGVIVFIFPSSIMITISLCIGALITFSGVQRLILGIAVRKIDEKGSTFYILESVLIILLGIIILTQKFVNLLGAFLIVYAISELAGYIYYTAQNKDYSEVLNKKVTKEMKESKAIEAIIDDNNPISDSQTEEKDED